MKFATFAPLYRIKVYAYIQQREGKYLEKGGINEKGEENEKSEKKKEKFRGARDSTLKILRNSLQGMKLDPLL